MAGKSPESDPAPVPATPSSSPSSGGHLRLFVPRDLDGFFGLALDNLVQLLLIVTLCLYVVGLPGDLLYDRMLPAVAVSLLVGNLFYAWQAHRLARREGRDDVTALPYGINTPSLIVFVLFVMLPEFLSVKAAALQAGKTDAEASSAAATAAWRLGCIACLGSGLIEFVGSFFAERIRRATPRAALLSTLAGIAIGFIAMGFAVDIWAAPLVAMPAMGIILVTYFSGVRFPGGLPGGLLAVLAGTVIAWGGTAAFHWFAWGDKPLMDAAKVGREWAGLTGAFAEGHGLRLPQWSAEAILGPVTAAELLKYAAVILPMGLFNLIGSLQNIESAEAAGDRYATTPSLAVNGLGTLAAGLFGSPFPTTIYIGHPGWKGLGARAGYSTLNGLAMTVICLTGSLALIDAVIPIAAGKPIVYWIGIVITAQAFNASPARHAPAAAIGLFPSLASMMAVLLFGMAGGMAHAGIPPTDLAKAIGSGANPGGFLLHGLIVLDRGAIFTAMFMAACAAALIDRRFAQAGVWCLVAAVVTGAGLMHAYKIVGPGHNVVDYYLPFESLAEGQHGYRAWDVAGGYLLCAAVFFGLHHRHRDDPPYDPDTAPQHSAH